MGTLVTVRSPLAAARASRITTLPRSTRASAAPRCVGAPEKMVTRGGRLTHGDRVGVVTARVIPSAGSRTAAWRDRNAVISRATPSGGSDEADNAYFDEDDTGKLLVACAIGLATGLGVALFNVAEHSTHDAVFIFSAFDPSRFQLEGERQSGPAADTLFQAVSAVAAPTAAGFLVTGLRFAAGGFEGEEVPRAPRWRGLRAGSPEDEDEETGVVDVEGLDTDADAEDTEDEDKDEAPGPEGPLRRAFKPVLKAAAAVVTLGSGAVSRMIATALLLLLFLFLGCLLSCFLGFLPFDLFGIFSRLGLLGRSLLRCFGLLVGHPFCGLLSCLFRLGWLQVLLLVPNHYKKIWKYLFESPVRACHEVPSLS